MCIVCGPMHGSMLYIGWLGGKYVYRMHISRYGAMLAYSSNI